MTTTRRRPDDDRNTEETVIRSHDFFLPTPYTTRETVDGPTVVDYRPYRVTGLFRRTNLYTKGLGQGKNRELWTPRNNRFLVLKQFVIRKCG